MARIEWVEQRLKNWALWHERDGGGGLGFASQSSFLREAAASGMREARVPVDEVDASITEDAVNTLKAAHEQLHTTLHMFYLGGVGVKECALQLSCAVSTVHARLGQADAHLAQWFADRKRAQEANAARLREQPDAARPKKLQTLVLPVLKKKRRRKSAKLSSLKS